MLYDNTRLAVARILGDGTRQRTRVFAELQSHSLFADRFGRPGKGNDKGKVEGLVGYARRNFLVPVPRVESLAALNAQLETGCRPHPTRRARRAPAGSARCRWCAIGAPTTRCRWPTAIARWWCAAMSRRW